VFLFDISIFLFEYNIMPNDVGLHNRLVMFRKFSLFDKASKDEVMAGSTSVVKFFASVTSQKAVIYKKHTGHTCVETHFSLANANMVYGLIYKMMILIMPNERKETPLYYIL